MALFMDEVQPSQCYRAAPENSLLFIGIIKFSKIEL